MVVNECHGCNTVLTLRPNRSLSWQQTKLFLLIMALPIFIIAIGWTLVGAWLVLPFAGLEFGLLAYLSYRVCYQSYQKDTISIDQKQVVINCGIGNHPCLHCLKRAETYLVAVEPKKPLDLLSLTLVDDSHRIEVGLFLNQHDREDIRTGLKKAGLVECSESLLY